MSRARLNIFLEPEHASRLDELAALKNVSKSGIVAAALAAYFSPDGPNQRNVAISRRLDTLSRQFERLERDQAVLLETTALWIRHQLAVTAPVPEGMQDAARAQGRARFADFVTQLARHLQRGGSFVGDVWHEIAPEHREPVTGDGAAAYSTAAKDAGGSDLSDAGPS